MYNPRDIVDRKVHVTDLYDEEKAKLLADLVIQKRSEGLDFEVTGENVAALKLEDGWACDVCGSKAATVATSHGMVFCEDCA